jgi:hypothetical protein
MMTWSSRLSGALGHNRTKAAAAFACFLSMAPLAVLAAVERVQVQLPPAADLAVEDAARDADGLPWRYAIPEAVSLTPARDGRWERLPDGARRWSLEVSSPGAASLNLGFPVYWLPAGATLVVRDAPGRLPALVFDVDDNADHGELWTPILPADALLVELNVPANVTTEPLLELGFINSGYRSFGQSPDAKAGTCKVDVVCSEGDDWRAEIASVGLISVNGSFTCTGAMMNNTSYDGTPYFLTADHCNISGTAAPTVVIYWNFESPVCGEQANGSLLQFTSGSTLRASWSTSDFTLLELDELPEPSFGVTYAGWNRGSAMPTSATAIHHPDSDEKSISFETAPLRTTSYLGTVEPGDGSHLRIIDWDLGTTEPGSSGSPLFDQDHLVVGQLHGGWAACGNDLSDWYGWLQRSWDGGGSAGTRLMDWLDPGATGAVTLPLLDPAAGSFAVTPTAAIEASGPQGGPFTVSDWEYTLTNDGEVAVNYTAAVDVDWLTVAPASGIIAIGGAATVTVSLASPSIGLDAGTHEAAVTFGNPNRGSSEPRTLRLEIIPDRSELAGVGPNPFRDYTSVRVALPAAGSLVWRVFDLRGRLVRGPVTLEGVLGENEIAWDGHDAGGRRLPTGAYVMAIQAPDREIRVPLACAR